MKKIMIILAVLTVIFSSCEKEEESYYLSNKEGVELLKNLNTSPITYVANSSYNIVGYVESKYELGTMENFLNQPSINLKLNGYSFFYYIPKENEKVFNYIPDNAIWIYVKKIKKSKGLRIIKIAEKI